MVAEVHEPYWVADPIAGEEVSSTGEGRHIVIQESYLIHPTHTDGLVDKGDPIAFFDGAGVALQSAKAATDHIPVDTEGVWRLSVTNTGENPFGSITVGQVLYITAGGVITDDWQTAYAIFGLALQEIDDPTNTQSPDYNDGDPITKVIAVKVHWMWPWWYYVTEGYGAPWEEA